MALTNSPIREQKSRIDISKYKDAWYRFLIHLLAYGCNSSSDLLKNEVKFVTFNYDTSLERILRTSLTSIDLFETDTIEEFLGGDRINHIYGSANYKLHDRLGLFQAATTLGDDLDAERLELLSTRRSFLDVSFSASKTLRTIDRYDKDEDAAAIVTARASLLQADVIYILGYGFDESNSRRIGLSEIGTVERPGREVMFTNFGNINTINKRVSRLISNYTREDIFIDQYIYRTNFGRFEKSINSVYDAMEGDFDLPA